MFFLLLFALNVFADPAQDITDTEANLRTSIEVLKNQKKDVEYRIKAIREKISQTETKRDIREKRREQPWAFSEIKEAQGIDDEDERFIGSTTAGARVGTGVLGTLGLSGILLNKAKERFIKEKEEGSGKPKKCWSVWKLLAGGIAIGSLPAYGWGATYFGFGDYTKVLKDQRLEDKKVDKENAEALESELEKLRQIDLKLTELSSQLASVENATKSGGEAGVIVAKKAIEEKANNEAKLAKEFWDANSDSEVVNKKMKNAFSKISERFGTIVNDLTGNKATGTQKSALNNLLKQNKEALEITLKDEFSKMIIARHQNLAVKKGVKIEDLKLSEDETKTWLQNSFKAFFVNNSGDYKVFAKDNLISDRQMKLILDSLK